MDTCDVVFNVPCSRNKRLMADAVKRVNGMLRCCAARSTIYGWMSARFNVLTENACSSDAEYRSFEDGAGSISVSGSIGMEEEGSIVGTIPAAVSAELKSEVGFLFRRWSTDRRSAGSKLS
jgi:hypothetical protein